MKVNGLETRCMARESRAGLISGATMVNTKTIRSTAMEFLSGLMGGSTLDPG